MTQADAGDPYAAWGGSPELSAWDTVMWRAEGSHRTTSMGMLVELLDTEPDAQRFLATHRDAVRRIPRLRERVVEPILPIAPPQWSPDPAFDLDAHVREVDLGGFAIHDDLMAFCEEDWSTPLDRHRPPWMATLVRGLAGGRSAYIFKCHHSLTDGIGLVQLMDLTHDHGADPDEVAIPSAASRRAVTSTELLAQALMVGPGQAPARVKSAAKRVREVVATPRSSADVALNYGRSLGRLLRSMPARSPLLATTGRANRLLMLDFDLDDLKRSGRSVGGSVNDAYVAAILGGLRRYHDKYGVEVDRIPIAMPISLRASDDPGGGNRFAGVRFAAPLSEKDPGARIRMVGEFVRSARQEPAISYLDAVSATLSRLPKSALIEVTARATAAADLQISNIPGLRRPAFLAGARVIGTYPFGPRPGVAGMITMMTLEQRCFVAANVDAQVFSDTEVLYDCLAAGFDEVLSLGNTTEVP
jgi:WS/DGAT/MGAT family acyltransferase